jgi:hypothetical protein
MDASRRRARQALRAFVAAAIAAAGVAIAPASAEPPVTVDPQAGPPDTVFHVEVPALYRVRELRDSYRFVLHGPGGNDCTSSVTDRIGITPPRSAKTVAVDLPGVRVANGQRVVPGPWCTGSFSGHVEFRDWQPKRHRYVVHRIGAFAVRVE